MSGVGGNAGSRSASATGATTLFVLDEDATMRGPLAPALRELGYDLWVIGMVFTFCVN